MLFSLAAVILGATAEAVLDKEVGAQILDAKLLKGLGIVCLKSILGTALLVTVTVMVTVSP